ncbi:type II secretion system F family protein [Candidatus Uhrbacteria bacterium]|nr:type II secretion system F family protein [Candidatus Uhrbacteria bacterium]
MKKHDQPWYKRQIDLFPVPQTQIVSLVKNFSIMLEAGIAVPEAIEVLVDQSSGTLKSVMKTVSVRLSSGERLWEAFSHAQRVFSPIFLSAVQAGEASGTLAGNLSHVAAQMEQDSSLRRSIEGALLYPGVVVSATLILGLLLATFVLPELASVFASLNMPLPWSTKTLLWLAGMFAQDGYWLTPLLIFSLFGLVVLWRQRFLSPVTDVIILRLPGLGLFFSQYRSGAFLPRHGHVA